MSEKGLKIIGLCLAKITEQLQTDIIQFIKDKAEERGYTLLIFATFSDLYHQNRSDMGEQAVFDMINYDMLDGMIILSETIKSDAVVADIIKNCNKHHLPVVSIDKAVEGAYNILYEYRHAFKEIVRHVIEEHGCRRINLIAGIKDNDFSEDRVEAFKEVLQEYEIPFEAERMGYGDFWEGPTVEVMNKFLESELVFPEAIVCCNDSMAMTACKVLEKNGYNIPQDVIVTGFDGAEMEKYHIPRLTTAQQNIEKACETAVETIMNVAGGLAVEKMQYVPFDMVASQSCGCVSLQDKEKVKRVIDVYNVMNYRMDYDEYVSRMSIGMSDADNFMDAREVVYNYAFYMSRFCICDGVMDTDYFDDERKCELTDRVKLFMKKEAEGVPREKYIDKIEDMIELPIAKIVPDLYDMLEHHSPVIVSTVHFLDKVLGYYVVSLFGYRENFINLRYFINTLNQSLYNLCNTERMRFFIMKDPMTAIYNRRGFYQMIKKWLAQVTEYEKYRIMVHSIDLDGLKYINDTFGHKAGDNAIVVAAEKLVEAAEHGEICARFGGDEYVVFGIVSKEEAEDVCQKYAKRFFAL